MKWKPKCFFLYAMFLCVFGAGSNEVITENPNKSPDEDDTSIQELHPPSAQTTAQTTRETNFLRDLDTQPEDSTTSAPQPTTVLHITFKTTDTSTSAPPTTQTPKAKVERFPVDVFSLEERRRGWVLLHIAGIIYMFVSLVILLEEFFVPALGVITDIFALSQSVAGATIMAAACSTPRLFAFFMGLFLTGEKPGIDTIVGSAVFNILFVIGMCALFSREMLHLTWWPLFRDVSFYILHLILLIIFFLDSVILWWESLMLVGGYSLYVVFMKYNVQIERFVKGLLHKHKKIVKVIALEEPEKVNGGTVEQGPMILEDKNRLKLKPALQRGGSSASLHNSTMRNTIFQLMIHTLDPLGEGKFKDKAETLNSVASKKTKGKTQDKKEDGVQKPEQSKELDPPKSPDTEKKETEDMKDDVPADSGSEEFDDSSDSEESESEESEEEEEGEEEEPLSLEWPDTKRKQVTYLLLLPIVLPLWLTVPDVRNQKSRKFFVMTFLGSIIWIAIFSYLMVWWAHQVGETIGISEEIMGLTILAAGTSIPDLITSVIVARKGLGDMAVSSSVGSNIFDITVGLPVPWLLYSSTHGFAPVAVSSNGLFCAIVLLFLMLLFVIVSIACCKWKMNKFLGFTMFLLYFIFLVLSVMLEDRLIICPVSI